MPCWVSLRFRYRLSQCLQSPRFRRQRSHLLRHRRRPDLRRQFRYRQSRHRQLQQSRCHPFRPCRQSRSRRRRLNHRHQCSWCRPFRRSVRHPPHQDHSRRRPEHQPYPPLQRSRQFRLYSYPQLAGRSFRWIRRGCRRCHQCSGIRRRRPLLHHHRGGRLFRLCTQPKHRQPPEQMFAVMWLAQLATRASSSLP